MTYYILIIDNKYGSAITLHPTKDDAIVELHNYVQENWDEGHTEQYGDVQTLSHDQAIDNYFECSSQSLDTEYYILRETTLKPSLTDEWVWRDKLDTIDHKSLEMAIMDEIMSGTLNTSLLVDLYNKALPEQRDIINETLVALTDWDLPDLLERSQELDES